MAFEALDSRRSGGEAELLRDGLDIVRRARGHAIEEVRVVEAKLQRLPPSEAPAVPPPSSRKVAVHGPIAAVYMAHSKEERKSSTWCTGACTCSTRRDEHRVGGEREALAWASCGGAWHREQPWREGVVGDELQLAKAAAAATAINHGSDAT